MHVFNRNKFVQVPIAVILGSDNKPQRIRVFEHSFGTSSHPNRIFNVLDFWANTNIPSTQYSITPEGTAFLSGYNWLPVIDSTGKLVRTGVIVATNIDPDFVYTIDARGSFRAYRPLEFVDLAKKDTKRKIFCNLDYSALPRIKLSNKILTFSSFSDDFNISAAPINLQGAGSALPIAEGYVGLTQGYFDKDVAILPDNWTKLAFSLMNPSARTIVLPKRVDTLSISIVAAANTTELVLPEGTTGTSNGFTDYWSLTFDGFFNLESLKFPDTLCALELNLYNCGKIKNISLPRDMRVSAYDASILDISVTNCANLESITFPELFSGSANISIIGDTKIKHINLPRYFRGAVTFNLERGYSLQSVTCSKALIVKKFEVGNPKGYPSSPFYTVSEHGTMLTYELSNK